MPSWFSELFARRWPVIGMLHAPPLPDSPRFGGEVRAIHDRVLEDADALVAGGADGLLLENFGDSPFYPHSVPPFTIAHLTALAVEVRRRHQVPLGINVLRNDGLAALAVAHAAGADFIRVNVLTGARLTDQGIIAGIAHELLRARARLSGPTIRILADVAVKHSAPLAPRPLADEIADTFERGGADGIIVSGARTGGPVEPDEVLAARAAAGNRLVLVGSGVTPDNLPLLSAADGFIVGTYCKRAGDAANPVDPDRVRALVAAKGRLASTVRNQDP